MIRGDYMSLHCDWSEQIGAYLTIVDKAIKAGEPIPADAALAVSYYAEFFTLHGKQKITDTDLLYR